MDADLVGVVVLRLDGVHTGQLELGEQRRILPRRQRRAVVDAQPELDLQQGAEPAMFASTGCC